MSRRPWIYAALGGAGLVVFIVWLAARPVPSLSLPLGTSVAGQSGLPAAKFPVNQGSAPTAAAASSIKALVTATATPAPVSAVSPAGRVVLEDGGRERGFTIARDELVRRGAKGGEESLVFAPVADLAGLRDRWLAYSHEGRGEVFLVAYEDGVARSLSTRRLITSQIRVELADGVALSETVPNAVSVEYPEYAPGFAVVKMADGFAALDALTAVRAAGGVRRADVLLARQQMRRSLPNDTLISSQWHLKNTGQSGGTTGIDVNVEPVWNYGGTGGLRGSGIVVGIVDDGLETAHPDLAANVRTDIDHDWNDSTPDDPNPVPGDDAEYGNHHGTCCAGNVAAVGNNSLGVSGTAPEAKIVGLRLIAADVGDADEAEAMAWNNDLIAIKSNSWGPDDYTNVVEAPGALTKAAFKSAAETGRGGLGTIFSGRAGTAVNPHTATTRTMMVTRIRSTPLPSAHSAIRALRLLTVSRVQTS